MPGEQVLSLQRFSQRVPMASAEHIWLGPLRMSHANEKHTENEWRALIKKIAARPAKR